MIKMIGEMSMPPRLGISLRIGRNAGSVTRYKKSTAIATN